MVVATVASGGDDNTKTPVFEGMYTCHGLDQTIGYLMLPIPSVGQEFEVLEHHDNGWIEVTTGGFIWPSWVAQAANGADTSIPSSPSSIVSERLDTRPPRPSATSVALRSISEMNHSNISSSVSTPARGSLSFTGSCGSRFDLRHTALHDDNGEPLSRLVVSNLACPTYSPCS
jgi:hypothetical protein